jgi:hypothetical protein
MPPKRSRALLFGLNYDSTPGATLHGCVQDVINVSDFLVNSLGLSRDSVRVCADDASTTAVSIVRALYDLAVQSRRERLEFVWIHYSGHGTQVLDRGGDELDGCDECLVPSDFMTAGVLTDDSLSKLMRFFDPSTRVLFVSDSCHSGTICDLKYRWLSPTRAIVENALCSIPARTTTLSGCLDSQTSADAYNVLRDGRYSGALTGCLLIALRARPSLLGDAFALLDAVRRLLAERGFPQLPALCSTHNLARDRTLY